jgi:predicted nucleic acid-binding protein
LTAYLLDTNIVSADAPAKRQVGPDAFAAWVRGHGDQLYISAVTIAEIEAGIARAIRIGATTKAEHLRRWLDAVEHFYAGRILAFGIEDARQAGTILDRARSHDPGFEDIAIAATAAARGFTVLTANERHFAPLGVPHLNPLKQLPSAGV